MLRKKIIGIIKNRLLAVGYFLLVLSSFNIYAQADDCSLYHEEIDVLAEDYPIFKNLLEEFYSDSAVYDFFYLKTVGGNKERSRAVRIYKNMETNKWRVILQDVKDKVVKDLESDTVLDKHLFANIQKGMYFNLCPYNSLNIVHIYMLKERGVLKFKLISEPYSILEIKEDNRINDVAKLYKELRSKGYIN